MQFVFSALARAPLPDGLPGPIRERRWNRSEDLRADCRFFDIDPAGFAPTEATTRFTTTIDRWGAESPMALLGALYVFEGSTNGGRFIAKAVSRGFRLTDRSGTLFLDPYGEDQRSRWSEFKADLDRSIGPEAIDQVVVAAQDTFGAVAEIGESVYRPG
jgi:heme oxygenase